MFYFMRFVYNYQMADENNQERGLKLLQICYFRPIHNLLVNWLK